ncbi:hypothetical protein E6R60_26940 [Streptomyces sp. A0642]|uniref:hypothetical protein n=1 Tax=Streptomyces sp. A0642 TaxID=2563100 RepID=UPI0010A2890E|nr:hypothetical protein [Streptomyces sp. A0642]THA72568.1 hypothetical protein E6R60_26940 [Streptomyces sp. A0642]
MSMSEHERRLLLTGTLDTSGVGGSPDSELPNVALAFREEEAVVFALPGKEAVSIPLSELAVEPPVPEPVVVEPSEAREPVSAARKTAAPTKKTPAPKKQAAGPANS